MALKAHDVRHLAVCARCGNLGDGRLMVNSSGAAWHDHCAYAKFGDRILDLPNAEREKFTIGAVGREMMRRLVELRERELQV